MHKLSNFSINFQTKLVSKNIKCNKMYTNDLCQRTYNNMIERNLYKIFRVSQPKSFDHSIEFMNIFRITEYIC